MLRIIVYLLKITVPFQYEWLDSMFKEVSLFKFCYHFFNLSYLLRLPPLSSLLWLGTSSDQQATTPIFLWVNGGKRFQTEITSGAYGWWHGGSPNRQQWLHGTGDQVVMVLGTINGFGTLNFRYHHVNRTNTRTWTTMRKQWFSSREKAREVTILINSEHPSDSGQNSWSSLIITSKLSVLW